MYMYERFIMDKNFKQKNIESVDITDMTTVIIQCFYGNRCPAKQENFISEIFGFVNRKDKNGWLTTYGSG